MLENIRPLADYVITALQLDDRYVFKYRGVHVPNGNEYLYDSHCLKVR